MKVNDPARPAKTMGGTWSGLAKREYFALELAKALIRAEHHVNDVPKLAISMADEMAKGLS